MSNANILTLDQRLAIAKAYLDENITIRMIADLSGASPSDVANISREVLGDKYFKTRYKKAKIEVGVLSQ